MIETKRRAQCRAAFYAGENGIRGHPLFDFARRPALPQHNITRFAKEGVQDLLIESQDS
jgi:hypothetical protein